MSIPSCFRFLRPYSRKLHHGLSAPKQAAYLQFYSAVRSFSNSTSTCSHGILSKSQGIEAENSTFQNGALQATVIEPILNSQKDDVRRRVEELQAAQALKYPRIKVDKRAISTVEFRDQYDSLKPEESRDGKIVTLRGIYFCHITKSHC